MTHNEKRTSAIREGQIALLTGGIYGAIHTISGHPLDTIKTKMQIQKGFINVGAWSVCYRIWASEGIRGYFKGCIAPLWGSSLYRGAMMSGYEFSYTWLEKNCEPNGFIRSEILFGFRPIIPISALFSVFIRGIFESPIEYVKVMGQTGQNWQINQIYRGLKWQIIRTTTLILPIFTVLDIARREQPEYMKTMQGSFIVTSIASSFFCFLCWPLETIKNLAQSNLPYPNATWTDRVRFLGGPAGLYRGVAPGTMSGGLRNGVGMIAMLYTQQLATRLGLRDES